MSPGKSTTPKRAAMSRIGRPTSLSINLNRAREAGVKRWMVRLRSKNRVAISVARNRFCRSACVTASSSSLACSSALTVSNSSLTDCISSWAVCSSSLVDCSSSFRDWSSSLVRRKSWLECSTSSTAACRCCRVLSSSSCRRAASTGGWPFAPEASVGGAGGGDNRNTTIVRSALAISCSRRTSIRRDSPAAVVSSAETLPSGAVALCRTSERSCGRKLLRASWYRSRLGGPGVIARKRSMGPAE